MITLEEVTGHLEGDGYFFLYVRQSPMIAQISNPNWNRSLYVTYISLTPFAEASGTMKEVRPRFKGELNRQRLQQRPWAYSTIKLIIWQGKARIASDCWEMGEFTIDFVE